MMTGSADYPQLQADLIQDIINRRAHAEALGLLVQFKAERARRHRKLWFRVMRRIFY